MAKTIRKNVIYSASADGHSIKRYELSKAFIQRFGGDKNKDITCEDILEVIDNHSEEKFYVKEKSSWFELYDIESRHIFTINKAL